MRYGLIRLTDWGDLKSRLRPQHFAKAAKEENEIMSKYDPAELNALFIKCRKVLGKDVYESVVNSPPRWSGFATSLEADIKYNDNDLSKIRDHHIQGALAIALEIWPYEAEAFANTVYGGDAS